MKKNIFKWIRRIVIYSFLFTIMQVLIFKFIPIYYTPLMVWNNMTQLIEGNTPVCRHQWVSINNISPTLPLAVVASEDNRFLEHAGFDFQQIEEAMDEAEKGKRQRGASTISQQTAKNVFLWQGKSYIRKGLEAYYTVLIELFWGKKRIMEVYLNSIEMGKYTYGAEAVANANFSKTAKQLAATQSALIAASLPNPIKFDSAHPSPYMLKRQAQILDLMTKVNPVDFDKQPQQKK